MNKSTLEKIRDSALYVESLLSQESELLKVHEYIKEPSHKKKVKGAIAFIKNQTPEHLDPPVRMGYEILRLLQSSPLTNEEIAAKIGKSAESVKQAIAALKAGGIDFMEIEPGTFQATGRPRKVRGASSLPTELSRVR